MRFSSLPFMAFWRRGHGDMGVDKKESESGQEGENTGADGEEGGRGAGRKRGGQCEGQPSNAVGGAAAAGLNPPSSSARCGLVWDQCKRQQRRRARSGSRTDCF